MIKKFAEFIGESIDFKGQSPVESKILHNIFGSWWKESDKNSFILPKGETEYEFDFNGDWKSFHKSIVKSLDEVGCNGFVKNPKEFKEYLEEGFAVVYTTRNLKDVEIRMSGVIDEKFVTLQTVYNQQTNKVELSLKEENEISLNFSRGWSDTNNTIETGWAIPLRVFGRILLTQHYNINH